MFVALTLASSIWWFVVNTAAQSLMVSLPDCVLCSNCFCLDIEPEVSYSQELPHSPSELLFFFRKWSG